MGKATEKEEVIYSISESAKTRSQESWFPGLQLNHVNTLSSLPKRLADFSFPQNAV